jgi:hypothetical protein
VRTTLSLLGTGRVLLTEGYVAYEKYAKKLGVTHPRCWCIAGEPLHRRADRATWPMKKPRPSEVFLSEKRAHKAQLRWKVEGSSRHHAISRRAPAQWTGWRHDGYLQQLAKCARTKPVRGKTNVVIPATFSIIDSPEQALQTIGLAAAAAGRDDVAEIHYDHSAVHRYDLAAEAILDMVAMDVQGRRKGTRSPLRFTGTFPQDPNADRFVRAIGITHYLEIAKAKLMPSEEAKLRRFFQSRRTPDRAAKAKVSSEKATVLRQFADQIDACLATVGKRMTPPGRAALLSYTGEIIDNIEQHAQSADWYISSYLDPAGSPPICEVAIFNFGLTFSDTFQELHAESFPRTVVAPYLNAHKRHGWFSQAWRTEDLLTLVALQGGVSSKSQGIADTRGQGTVDLITFFQDICTACAAAAVATEARMAMLSGDTHILFDGTYRMKHDSTGRDVLAFNRSNSLAEPPDANYVRHLQGVRFPGTVVSIRFPLQQTAAVSEGRRE